MISLCGLTLILRFIVEFILVLFFFFILEHILVLALRVAEKLILVPLGIDISTFNVLL